MRRRRREPVQEQPEVPKRRRRRRRPEPVQETKHKRRRTPEKGTSESDTLLDRIKRIRQPWGGFTPFKPENCPSKRYSVDPIEKIKWVDNTICLKYCEKKYCTEHSTYRKFLNDTMKENAIIKAKERSKE